MTVVRRRGGGLSGYPCRCESQAGLHRTRLLPDLEVVPGVAGVLLIADGVRASAGAGRAINNQHAFLS